MSRFHEWASNAREDNVKNYHVTPVCLVPNGRAHLGHVAGPLLKADIINRSLKVRGHRSHMISCTDPDELHVVIKAMALGREPSELARSFHKMIEIDFQSIGIKFDTFIDPRSAAWEFAYERINRELIDDLIALGHAVVQSEQLPVLEATGANYVHNKHVPAVGDYMVGGWVSGQCISCGSRLVGFFCEACGEHANHEEIGPKTSVYFDAEMGEKECRSLFLTIENTSGVVAHLENMGFPAKFLDIIKRYIERVGGKIRLTLPTSWGLSYNNPHLSGNHVIFTYSGVLYGCHLLAGEAYQQLTDDVLNPFDKDSDVINILSFGIDNTVPFAFGVTALGLSNSYYKPVDRFYTNYFYNLAGSKFSTSRGHVIWAGDIASIPAVNVDFLRQYLAETAPEDEPGNFDLADFVSSHNLSAAQASRIITRVKTRSFEHNSTSDNDAILWLNSFQKAYALDGFDPRSAARFTRDLLEYLSQPHGGSFDPDFLKLAGILLQPVMPELGGWLCQAVGQEADVTLRSDSPVNVASSLPEEPFSSLISFDELGPCLPDALKPKVDA